MPSKSTTKAALAALLAAASQTTLAQSTTVVTHWCPEVWDSGNSYRVVGDGEPDGIIYRTRIYASVIDASPTATTYSLDCGYGDELPDPDGRGCKQNPTVIYTLGPKTVEGSMIQPEKPWDNTRGFDCDVNAGATTASCDFFLDGRQAEAIAETGRWPSDPDEYGGIDFSLYYQPFTITAGLEKLSGGGGGGSGGGNGAIATATDGSAPAAQATEASTGSAPVGAHETGSAAPTSGASQGVVGRWMMMMGSGVAAALAVSVMV
ncbi:hypothetical protein QBC44DRAFT_361972 [Cladorrhinum sp. PSN332]|nr:hypothetical protein QBC44DRAFT_361972 [Cladorrhinum sp. PSN332]